MEILSSIASYAIIPIAQELGYLCCNSNNIKELEKQIKKLEDTKDAIRGRADEVERNVEAVDHRVRSWLVEVDEIIEASKMILVNEDQYSCGKCLDFVKLYKRSKRAKQQANQIIDIIGEANNFTNVSFKVVLSGVVCLTRTRDFMDFESRKSTIEQIMKALKEDNDNMIGLHGMGGVGKTMLVKEISRKLKEEKSFENVITSTISRTPNIRTIQGELGDQLGLKFEQETESGRASKLHMRLEKEKNILIVLDDVWDFIDLEAIGISCAERRKILLTSRDKLILSKYVNKIFEIKVLEQDESWSLFKEMVGAEIVESSDFGRIVFLIVKECAQLPIAITTVAKALKGEQNLEIWEDALNRLKNPLAMDIGDMDKRVYSSLRFSYEHLKSEAKLLFLLCSMFPEDFHINVEDLHIYAMGMGLLRGVKTLENGRARIASLVKDLTSSSLLLEGYHMDYKYVKMHDIIRDTAIIIASEHSKICTYSLAKGLNQWPAENKYTAVYLQLGDLDDFPRELMLSKVQLLILEREWSQLKFEISINVFEEMKVIKVLKLRNVKISLLPSPRDCDPFANLQSLHLVSCELGNIDMIGELRKLEILSLRETEIVEIPITFGQLTQLKMLDLSYCMLLKLIPPNILSRLTKLEELYMDGFKGWEGGESYEKNASLCELKHLSCLSTVNLCIPNEKVIPKQLFLRELCLKRFKFCIGGCDCGFIIPRKYSKAMYLKTRSKTHLEDWVKILLEDSELLRLHGPTVARFLDLLELDEIRPSHLKSLDLSSSFEVEHLIHKNKPFWKIISNMEFLNLFKLQNLESINHVDAGEFPFNKLLKIYVRNCDKMKNLFSIFKVNDVVNLKSIEIHNCEMVEVLVTVANELETCRVEFTQLETLTLWHSPQIVSFCSKFEMLGQLTSKQVGRTDSSDIVPFFNRQVSLPNLETLSFFNSCGSQMIVSNEFDPHSFTKLTTVQISECHNLQKVFPSNIITKLACLKTLEIKDCKSLEGIFEAQEPNATDKTMEDALYLPQLTSLGLIDLPNIKYVWKEEHGELLIFENLKHLSIAQCPKLKREYPIKVRCQLTGLGIDYRNLIEWFGKDNLVKMVDSSTAESIERPDGPEFFLKLKILELWGSKTDKWIDLPIEIVEILHKLTHLAVRDTLFEEIFTLERLANGGSTYCLRQLLLDGLPNLKNLLKESSQMNTSSSSLLQNLEHLIIWSCGKLNTLVQSSTSFINLVQLAISNCDGLTNLLNHSVARNLVQLNDIDLRNCKRIITVIAAEGGAEEERDEEIVFKNLRTLRLDKLPEMINFSSEKCTMRFPRLHRASIKDCPKMKEFSLGIATTPHFSTVDVQLIRFKYDKFEQSSSKDLNAIIREAKEIECYASLQENLKENPSDHPSTSSSPAV